MGDISGSGNQVHAIDAKPVVEGNSKFFGEDGRPKRTGNIMTACAHIITAVIGSGILSLAWTYAQLGWIAGPVVMVLFSFVTLYTSSLLITCCHDTVIGKRNTAYLDAVKSHLGGMQFQALEINQYLFLFGAGIGYTITACKSISHMLRYESHIGKLGPCLSIGLQGFGLFLPSLSIGFEIVLSQIPNFDKLWWLSDVAAVMSFTYSGIGLGLGIAKVAENGNVKGTMTGVTIGSAVSQTQKNWSVFQALGNIAFTYSFSVIILEIEDTIKSPSSEPKTMKTATNIALTVISIFYVLCGCFGYAAFGDLAPGNLLTDKGFNNPHWLIDIANAAIFIHLVGAYQVFIQPAYAYVEKKTSKYFPTSYFITEEIKLSIPCVKQPYSLNLFRLVWKTSFVIVTTVLLMIFPFFNSVVGFLGAVGYWSMTVYFPVEMYIAQKKIPKWSRNWISLQILSLSVLVIALQAAAGSVTGLVHDLKVYKPFKTSI